MDTIAAAATLLLITLPAGAQDEDRTPCPFERAAYQLVEDDAASLQLEPFASTVGIAGTMTLPDDIEIPLTISTSNGYATSYADMTVGPHAITSIALAFTAEMQQVRFNAGDPAPEYLIFPQAGLEAYTAQSGTARQIDVPAGAWQITGCNL